MDKATENYLKMEQELKNLKHKFEIIKNEKAQRDKEYKEVMQIKEDPESYINERIRHIRNQFNEKSSEVDSLKHILEEKENTIRNISIAHTQFKQQLENIREELMYNQSEKENLSKKLNNIERGDSRGKNVLTENLREQNKKLLQTCMKLLKTNESVHKSTSKKVVKRPFSNSMKNSTVLLSQARRLSSPSPSKKRKSSKRKIKRRKFSSGARKSKYFKRGRNMLPNETSPFPIMFHQLTPLVSNSKDKNMQMYTQKFRTEKQDLHDAKVKITNLQKYISGLKIEDTRIREKYKKVKKILENINVENIV